MIAGVIAQGRAGVPRGTLAVSRVFLDPEVILRAFVLVGLNRLMVAGFVTDSDTILPGGIPRVLNPSVWVDLGLGLGSETVFIPSVVQGGVLVPAPFADVDAIKLPSIAIPGVIQVDKFVDDDVVYVPDIFLHGSLRPGKYVDLDAFYGSLLAAPKMLRPGLYTTADSFFVPTARIAIAPSLFIDSDVIFYYPPALLSSVLVSSDDAFFTHVAVFPQKLLPSLAANDDAFIAPTVLLFKQILTPSLVTDSEVFYVHQLVGGGSPALSADLVTDSDAFYGPSITAFTPSDLIGLVGWWDASVTASLTLSGSNITGVADQSGAGNSLGNSSGANRAIYSATGLNSRPAMLFGGPPGAFLNRSAFPMGTGNTLTVFLVVTLEATSSSDARLISYPAPGFADWNSVQSWLMSRPTTTSTINFYRNGTSVSGTMGLSTPRRLIVTVNSSGVQTLYIDGVASTTATLAGAWGTGGQITLGTDGTNHWGGAVSEWGIATGFSDATTVAKLDTYLKNKWGL